MLNTPNLMKLAIAISIASLAGCESADWAESDAVAPVVDSVKVAAEPAPEPAVSAPAPKQAVQEPAPEPTEPAIDAEAELIVKRLVIAHDVEGREPVGSTTIFASGESERIYAFVEVGNPSSASSAVYVSFVRDGEPERGAIELRVGESSRWRTWAYTRLAKDVGDYSVIVRNALGEELGRSHFEIVSADQPRS